MNKKVSVIIPCYNVEMYVKQAVLSIMHQTYKNLEIICIDDGSTDNTNLILNELALQDNRLLVVRNEHNLKLIKTLNKGIILSTGEYIARMDADDISLPGRIEKQVEYLENNKLAVCGTFVVYYREYKYPRFLKKTHIVTQPQAVLLSSLFDSPLIHPSILAKAQVLKKYKYNDDEKSFVIEDYELWWRMLLSGESLGILPDYLLQYRINEFGESTLRKDIQCRNHLFLSDEIIKTIVGYPISNNSVTIISGLLMGIVPDQKIIKTAIYDLNRIYETFLSKNKLSAKELGEIKEWLHYKKIYVWIKGLQKGNVKTKFLSLIFLSISFTSVVKYYVKPYISIRK